MTLTRPELDELLVDYLYDELEPARRAAFERGLAEHPELAAEVEAHQRTRTAAAALPVVAMPAGLLDGVLAEAQRAAAASAPGRGASGSPGIFERLFRVFNQPAFAMGMVALVVVGVGVVMLDGPMPGESDPNSQRLAPGPIAQSSSTAVSDEEAAEGPVVVAPVVVTKAEREDERPSEGAEKGIEGLVDATADFEGRGARDKDSGLIAPATGDASGRAGGASDEPAERATRPRAVRDVTRSAPRALGGVTAGDGLGVLGAKADEQPTTSVEKRAPSGRGGERADDLDGGAPGRPAAPADESNFAAPAADRPAVDQPPFAPAEAAKPEVTEAEPAKSAPPARPTDARRRAAAPAERSDAPIPPPPNPSSAPRPASAPDVARETDDRVEDALSDDDREQVLDEREEQVGGERAPNDTERVAALWRRYAELVAAERWSDAEEVLEELARIGGQRERVRTTRESLASRRSAAEKRKADTKEGALEPAPIPASKPASTSTQ